ncbi:MAG: 6-carboxytetrahydropterin synthase [Salinivirgaceae bacterium]|jgi:6-pyruvoyltetrahydropterin/6-carboxytetrahydropterin synthase|nr:6-carboxytetrahydropterin synthase [Salinivirgaceae bacterium]
MVHITRRERFNAAHRLFRPELNDSENYEVFGKCSNPNWHGHNYELFVTAKGKVSDETGFVLNLKSLSHLVREEIVDKVDHKNLNTEVDFLQGKLISTENLAKAFWNQLEAGVKLLGAQLYCIKITETENNFVEYYGEE